MPLIAGTWVGLPFLVGVSGGLACSWPGAGRGGCTVASEGGTLPPWDNCGCCMGFQEAVGKIDLMPDTLRFLLSPLMNGFPPNDMNTGRKRWMSNIAGGGAPKADCDRGAGGACAIARAIVNGACCWSALEQVLLRWPSPLPPVV